MKNTETSKEAHLTAWHVMLVELLRLFSDPMRVDVQDFVKLGTLPLEADVILLRKKEVEASAGFRHLMRSELDFLEPRMRDLTVLEYKSPRDPLRWDSVDRSRAYGLLAKQKYQVVRDRQVSVVMLYSQVQRGLFEALAEDGLAFETEEEGIRVCQGSMVLYAVDLMALGQRRPQSPLNLVSARHRQYSQDPSLDANQVALVQRIQYLIRQREVRGMALDKLPGYEDLNDDFESIKRRFLADLTPRERLEGLTAKDILEGLAPKERLEGLAPKDILDGLSPGVKQELLALLQDLHQQRR
jgi:hypothetical protein